jgi:hypothetical protein
VEMARRSATAPADGKRPKPLLTVLVGEDAFRHVLELADGTLISPSTAAELLDEAVIETMLFDGPSRVLDLGHQRSFVGAARRAVEVVHRTCTGAGCHVRSERLGRAGARCRCCERSVSPTRTTEPDVRVPAHPALHMFVPVGSGRRFQCP